MPKKIVSSFTPARMQEEVFFTRSALQADPQAADLLPTTDLWKTLVDDAYALRAGYSQVESDALANAQVAQGRLAVEVKAFAGTLLGAAMGNRTSPVFTRFFPIAPSDVLGGRRADQVRFVQAWLATQGDPSLEAHREPLSTWVDKLDVAVCAYDKLRFARVDRDAAYETLCAQLTADRRQLHASLSSRATQLSLDSTWPDVFFRIG